MLRCRPGCASRFWTSTTTPYNADRQDQQSSQHHTPVADDHSRMIALIDDLVQGRCVIEFPQSPV